MRARWIVPLVLAGALVGAAGGAIGTRVNAVTVTTPARAAAPVTITRRRTVTKVKTVKPPAPPPAEAIGDRLPVACGADGCYQEGKRVIEPTEGRQCSPRPAWSWDMIPGPAWTTYECLGPE